MQRAKLTQGALETLRPALGEDEAAILNEFRLGALNLYRTDDGEILALVRFEFKEAVFVAVAGRNLRRHRQALIDFAIARGMHSIRFHTKNPAHLRSALSGLQIQMVSKNQGRNGGEYIYRMGIL